MRRGAFAGLTLSASLGALRRIGVGGRLVVVAEAFTAIVVRRFSLPFVSLLPRARQGAVVKYAAPIVVDEEDPAFEARVGRAVVAAPVVVDEEVHVGLPEAEVAFAVQVQADLSKRSPVAAAPVTQIPGNSSDI